MMKMKYKDFEFPSNPSVLKVELSDNVVEKPLFGSDSAVYSISHNAALISGEGCFWGKDGIVFSRELKALQKSSSSGWLFLPDGGCYNAFLTALTVKEDARKGCVFYTFSFTENCNHKKDEFDFGFTYALENENMFDISHRCGVEIERLMQLNNIETPFSVSVGDKVVLR
ncbi:MAG: LysM peptidoglycan-binding domain-containing protein [Eubacterium sp.]|nr:LysM peptidoglycan-binding domain-containing protein [Eubacterium sp.]